MGFIEKNVKKKNKKKKKKKKKPFFFLPCVSISFSSWCVVIQQHGDERESEILADTLQQ